MIFAGISADSLGIQALPQTGEFLSDTDDDTFSLPGVDGRRWLRSTQTPREFRVLLRAQAATKTALRAKLDAAAAWLASGPAPLVFDGELPDRAWTARRRGKLSWTLDGASLRVAADLILVADDPHPYALVDDVTVLTAAGVAPRTAGNAVSWPLVELTGLLGASDTVTLTLWGQEVVITGPLAADEVARLDYAEFLFTVTDSAGETLRNLAPKLSTLRRVECPVGGGPVSWTTTGGGTVTEVRIEANSRWL